MSNPDEGIRKLSRGAGGKLENMPDVLADYNTLAKDKEIEDRWRSFARPESSRNLANQVEDEVVDALNAAVTGSYADLSHRYYAMKAAWLGKEQLDHWDRNAPLPDADNSVIPWDRATETVLTAYRDFSPDLAEIGQRFFDNAWIDAPVKRANFPAHRASNRAVGASLFAAELPRQDA